MDRACSASVIDHLGSLRFRQSTRQDPVALGVKPFIEGVDGGHFVGVP